ncbi:condensation domain-containing protein [Alkalimonas amylolytica]|uniref:Uncharacterized protein, contains a NRPS condensation (Elongation) domain n=1 Tax=Alkalimonas amylolytica TaxID=152573 RepID=A0A1H4AWJ7_ALKAM|nr:condensation domain-containing protein [Alkalimonas amylolytica]SEA40273.1 Uncharacterized protein, contains a NRPS condensation (elongation) domain [Alkalimonas amylolytica]
MKLTHLNMNYILWGKLMNSHSAEIIQISGDINFERLQQAINIAVNKQPVLKCCIKRKWLRYYWHPLPENTPIAIERCDYSELTDDELKAKIASHTWCRQADYQTERLVRFYLIDAGNKVSYLQSVSHHAAADAQSGFILFKDIAAIYTALTHGTPVDKTERRVNNRDVGRVYLNKLPFTERVRIFCRGIKAFLTKPGFAVSSLDVAEPKTDAMRSIYTDALPDELLPKLKATAKHYNTSVHVLFVLAMIKFKQQFNPGTDKAGFQLLDVLTLRQFSDEDVSMSYDAYSINHFKDFYTNKSDEQLIADITAYITGLKAGKIFEDWYQQKIWVGAFLLLPQWLKAKYVAKVLDDKLRSNMLISNLGVFNFNSYAFGEADVTDFFSFPNVGGPLRLGLFFCTFKGRLKLTLVYDARCFEHPVKHSVMEPFVQVLHAICRVSADTESAVGYGSELEKIA